MPPFEVHHEVVHFSGHVQGVGFRYSVLQVAKEYDVTGFVQNLTDGRVCLEIEGELKDINDLIESIEDRMSGFVRQTERRGGRRPAQFKGFAIR